MAIVKYGALITSMRGKLGGHILQTSPVGNFIRTNVRPKPSFFEASIADRNFLSLLALNWSNLSASDRQTWVDYCGGYTFYNRYGEAFTPTPYQLFVYINFTLQKNLQTMLDVCNPYGTTTGRSCTISDLDLSAEAYTYSWSGAIGAGEFLVLQTTRPFRVGNMSRYRKWLWTKSYYTLFGTSFDAYDDCISAWGSVPPVDYQFGYRYCLMSATPFYTSQWVEGISTVVS